VKPDVFLMKDKDGKLQPLLGWPFEYFMELYKFRNRLDGPEQKPRYSLQRAALSGKADDERAELTAQFSVVVRENGWVRVPLRLGTAILTKQVAYEGDGEHFLHFDGDGYVAWVKGAPDSVHKLSLDVLVPVSTVGSEKKLKLMLPRATVSEMKLQVATDQAKGRVSDESTLLSAEKVEGSKTNFTVLGLGGEFELAWREADAPVARIPTTLEASAAVLVDIDGQRVRSEAALTVRSFGGLFNHFRVQLPPGAELVRGNGPPGAVITMVNEPDIQRGKNKVLEVKLEKETAGPVEIPLVTERPFNAGDMDAPVELAGFEVLGAVRQHGHVAVQPGGSWQIIFDPAERRHARQVDELPEALRRDGVVAGFEYFLQPYSLEARIVEQKTRIQVEPTYVFRVSPQRVVMTAVLKYTVRGSKARALTIRMPTWKVDRSGPESLLDANAPIVEQDGLCQIPLSQATSGQFEIELEAHRNIEAGAKRLDLELPIPQADTVGAAEVFVLAATNVELDPRPETTTGLNLQGTKTPLRAVAAGDPFQEEALYYRSESLPARFSADFDLKQQAVTSSVDSRIELTAREVRVEQRMSFQVAYESVSALGIDVPRPITEDKLTITLDGQKTSLIPRPDRAESDAQGPQRMRLALPKPRLGRFEIEISYVVPREKLLPAASIPLSVPLIMPASGTITRNLVTISSETSVSLNPNKGAWSVSDDGVGLSSQTRRLTLTSEGPTHEVALVVRQGEKHPSGTSVIERGLIQTFLTSAGRRDRATYRFRASEPVLRLSMPEGIDPSSLQVLVDGARMRTSADPNGRVILPLSGTISDQHSLEINYRFEEGLSTGPMRLEVPQFPAGTWVDRLYWQVNLPNNQHIARAPAGFTSESRWVWQTFFWAREPSVSQRELEAWVGQAPGLTAAARNQYLYSTVEPRAVMQLWTVRRSILVFAASLVLLALGCVLIYVPAARHPVVLLTLGVLLFSGTLIDPDSALMLTQSASLGLLLLLGTLVFGRKEPNRPFTTVPVRSSSQAIIDRSRTQLYYRRATPGSETATAAAPVAMQLSEPEGPA